MVSDGRREHFGWWVVAPNLPTFQTALNNENASLVNLVCIVACCTQMPLSSINGCGCLMPSILGLWGMRTVGPVGLSDLSDDGYDSLTAFDTEHGSRHRLLGMTEV